MKDRFEVVLFFEKSETKDDWLGRTSKSFVIIPINFFKPERWSIWLGRLIPSVNKKYYFFYPHSFVEKLNVNENIKEIENDLEFLKNVKNKFTVKEIYPPEVPPERVGLDKVYEIEWK